MPGTACSEPGDHRVNTKGLLGSKHATLCHCIDLGDAMFARFMFGSLAATFLMIPVHLTPAFASGLSPAEAPPATHTASRYVDSRGCVFLRSTFGGQVGWVPLFGPDAKPVCGESAAPAAPAQTPAQPVVSAPVAPETPEGAADAVAPVAATPAESEIAEGVPRDSGIVVVEQQTSETPAPQPQVAATPRRIASRPAAPRRAPAQQASTRQRDCPEAAPYGQLVRAGDGRLLVRCVSEPERLLERAGQGIPLDPGAPAAEVAEAIPAPAITTAPTPTAVQAPAAAPAETAVAVAAPVRGRFVQVASFAVPDNARRTRAALSARDIPAHSQAARQRGRQLEVILAGPFADDAELRRALGAVRAMGFRDAFVRG